ncbi:MAG: type I 3-dehydroquinate dehydratase, partial [Nitrososphaerales archaeon]
MQLEADNAVTSSFKLCISISAENVEQLSRKMKRARAHKPDFLELRLDYIKNLDMSKLNQVRKLLRGNEFLTIRSRSEGG